METKTVLIELINRAKQTKFYKCKLNINSQLTLFNGDFDTTKNSLIPTTLINESNLSIKHNDNEFKTTESYRFKDFIITRFITTGKKQVDVHRESFDKVRIDDTVLYDNILLYDIQSEILYIEKKGRKKLRTIMSEISVFLSEYNNKQNGDIIITNFKSGAFYNSIPSNIIVKNVKFSYIAPNPQPSKFYDDISALFGIDAKKGDISLDVPNSNLDEIKNIPAISSALDADTDSLYKDVSITDLNDKVYTDKDDSIVLNGDECDILEYMTQN